MECAERVRAAHQLARYYERLALSPDLVPVQTVFEKVRAECLTESEKEVADVRTLTLEQFLVTHQGSRAAELIRGYFCCGSYGVRPPLEPMFERAKSECLTVLVGELDNMRALTVKDFLLGRRRM